MFAVDLWHHKTVFLSHSATEWLFADIKYDVKALVIFFVLKSGKQRRPSKPSILESVFFISSLHYTHGGLWFSYCFPSVDKMKRNADLRMFSWFFGFDMEEKRQQCKDKSGLSVTKKNENLGFVCVKKEHLNWGWLSVETTLLYFEESIITLKRACITSKCKETLQSFMGSFCLVCQSGLCCCPSRCFKCSFTVLWLSCAVAVGPQQSSITGWFSQAAVVAVDVTAVITGTLLAFSYISDGFIQTRPTVFFIFIMCSKSVTKGQSVLHVNRSQILNTMNAVLQIISESEPYSHQHQSHCLRFILHLKSGGLVKHPKPRVIHKILKSH